MVMISSPCPTWRVKGGVPSGRRHRGRRRRGVEKGNHAALPDPDKAGIAEISGKHTGQQATQIVPGQRKSRSIQRFF
jgi:hypothetical protein